MEIAGLVKQAEHDSRCKRMKSDKLPLVWGDINLDTVLCPECLVDLTEEFNHDADTKLEQCPYCGQLIDTTLILPRKKAKLVN